ncbi:hypothetical protein DPEC_G00291510 [Dallia pectoralis]|uniref:Uncharacterized protein n=1 Tax=Dallia pectoralis TaxID=75939 RepID=A0ACC2FHT6_DALPE|nr:hypothetical protein DPEC_G00291510 [Dallia pectoralis]
MTDFPVEQTAPPGPIKAICTSPSCLSHPLSPLPLDQTPPPPYPRPFPAIPIHSRFTPDPRPIPVPLAQVPPPPSCPLTSLTHPARRFTPPGRGHRTTCQLPALSPCQRAAGSISLRYQREPSRGRRLKWHFQSTSTDNPPPPRFPPTPPAPPLPPPPPPPVPPRAS